MEPVREVKRREEAREPNGFSRRSPPTLYTPDGPIQVCGQCLLPGHRVEECRRDVTCRRCGGVGHKAVRCRAEHRDVTRLHKAAVAGKARGRINLTQRTGGAAPATIPTAKMVEEEAPHAYDISLSLDNEMMRYKTDLRRFTVATVTSLREGIPVCRNSLSEELRRGLGDHGEWTSRLFRDGRFLVTCSSPEEARSLENGGALHLPRFSLTFERWSPDMGATGRAEGEKRWILLRDVPLHCGHRDTVARLVKPIGELVYTDDRGAKYVDDVRAAIRLRQGCVIPSVIRASIGTRKHHIKVEMERGEEALPWCKLRPAASSPVVKLGTPMTGNREVSRGEQSQPLTREEKGKAPEVGARREKKGRGIRPPGIVIREVGYGSKDRGEGCLVTTGPTGGDRSMMVANLVGNAEGLAGSSRGPAVV